MRDVYQPGLDAKINKFLSRKAREYPELHLLDGIGQDSIRPHQPTKSLVRKPTYQPHNYVIHTF